MRTKRQRTRGFPEVSNAVQSHPVMRQTAVQRKLRSTMSRSAASAVNEYSCAIEKTQNGKYNVRVRAAFAGAAPVGTTSWMLRTYFLASSFNAAMKKLEQALQVLQKNEEKLRFWGVERTDDPNFAGDLLQEFGLWLDRRHDFPRKIAELSVNRQRQVSASMLAQVRRTLADSIGQERFVYQAALAGD
jgi:hypothetical protein